MSILSIHIDESGNLNFANRQNSKYCLSMVFHNQDENLTEYFVNLDRRLNEIKCNVPFIHSSPLIRQDIPFDKLLMTERMVIYRIFSRFIELLPIKYKTFIVSKTFFQNEKQLQDVLENQIKIFINSHLEILQSFDKIIIYYDNGQTIVKHIIQNTFSNLFPNRIEFRTAFQKDYKLLQVADYICTIEQSRIRWEENKPTKSEKDFFFTRKFFIKNFYKKINKKNIQI